MYGTGYGSSSAGASSWTPGFWSGGALGYLLGRQTAPRYYGNTGGSFFGSSSSGRSSFGGMSSSSGGSFGGGSTTRTSTAFASTRRR
jgi:hypothetical protein